MEGCWWRRSGRPRIRGYWTREGMGDQWDDCGAGGRRGTARYTGDYLAIAWTRRVWSVKSSPLNSVVALLSCSIFTLFCIFPTSSTIKSYIHHLSSRPLFNRSSHLETINRRLSVISPIFTWEIEGSVSGPGDGYIGTSRSPSSPCSTVPSPATRPATCPVTSLPSVLCALPTYKVPCSGQSKVLYPALSLAISRMETSQGQINHVWPSPSESPATSSDP